MVVVPRLHEMKDSETRKSAKIIELTKHWKTDSVLRLWSHGTTALYKCIVVVINIIIIIQFPAYYEQINVIRSKLIWTSWRPHVKIWAYGLNFLGVFTPKRPLLKTLNNNCEIWPKLIKIFVVVIGLVVFVVVVVVIAYFSISSSNSV